ncbi:hypothetical protein J31TS4_20280 [Paenibacillus sp. J31TS4]|uniref:HRDC domain-containing protein n=1 Tax=Paenibacillus sp. J31TS4 TaxID=2807195 RepID=UPI001B23FA50|nr:HRDC domain-containing protein [Paenibacillus sp. J31TS4]GIP38748.1 hypothetical protein J31TS4_20280 [Paenibacillus sp. J31TS4]
MKVVFCNTMERQTEENRVQTAQVRIGERKGDWQVGWEETTPDGGRVQELWYEGPRWEEALAAFRGGMQDKAASGFEPLVREGAPRPVRLPRNLPTLKLQYYSEKNANPEAYQVLRQWRKDQAAKEGRSAFLVAGNRLLQTLGTFLPKTEEELRSIPGFGEHKIGAYGAAVLELLQPFPRELTYPLDWVDDAVDADDFASWLEREAAKRETAEQKKRETKRLLLEAIGEGLGLEAIGRRLSVERREIVPLVEELDRDGCDVSGFVERELSSIAAEELEQADRLFADLGDRYLKPVAQQLYSEEEMKGREAARIYEWLRLYRLKFRRKAAS